MAEGIAIYIVAGVMLFISIEFPKKISRIKLFLTRLADPRDADGKSSGDINIPMQQLLSEPSSRFKLRWTGRCNLVPAWEAALTVTADFQPSVNTFTWQALNVAGVAEYRVFRS